MTEEKNKWIRVTHATGRLEAFQGHEGQIEFYIKPHGLHPDHGFVQQRNYLNGYDTFVAFVYDRVNGCIDVRRMAGRTFEFSRLDFNSLRQPLHAELAQLYPAVPLHFHLQ